MRQQGCSSSDRGFRHEPQQPVRGGNPQRSISTVVTFPEAASDTRILAGCDLGRSKRVEGGGRYRRAGIFTVDLVSLATSQRALIGAFDRSRGMALMEAMDACNKRWGRGTAVPGPEGLIVRRTWPRKFDMRSPRLRRGQRSYHQA